MSAVFEARSTVAAELVQDFNANELANTLWVMAIAGAHRSDAFEARSPVLDDMFQDFNE